MHNYSFSVAWSAEDEEYVATSAEFPGLSGLAESPQEAISELRVSIEAAIAAAVEDREPIPEPQQVGSHSGQFRVRVPKSTHSALSALAAREGMSLNQLVVSMLSEGLGEARAGALLQRQLGPLIRQCQLAAAQISDGVVVLEQTNAAAVSVVFSQPAGQLHGNTSDIIPVAVLNPASNRGTIQ